MTRKILKLGWEITPIDVDIPTTETLYEWLLQYAADGDALLSHAIDGVIWGRVLNRQIFISHDINPQISPGLRIETLQQLRLFNADREFYLWRDYDGWHAYHAAEFSDESTAAVLEEHHILWGTKGVFNEKHGFTVLEDGAQGLRHIVPIDASGVNEKNIRACIWVRHYLSEDPDTGVSHIAYSRLTGIGMTNDVKK